MIDFISMQVELIPHEILTGNKSLEFSTSINEETAELLTKNNKHTRKTKYKDFGISLIKDILTLEEKTYFRGSIHKYFSGGVNYTDFSLNDLKEAIKRLKLDFEFDSFITKIQSLEFGVNILLPVSCKEFLESLVSFDGISPNKEKFKGSGLMYVFEKSNHLIKVYDKGLQYSKSVRELAHVDNLLRVEIKVKKMDYLKKKGIQINTLEDLAVKEIQKQLAGLLLDAFDHLVYIDPTIDLDKIEEKERMFMVKSDNPRHWQELRESNVEKSYSRNHMKLQNLVRRYSNRDIKNDVRKLISDKLDQLTKDVRKLPFSKVPQMSENYPYISGNIPTIERRYCKTTKMDITHQRGKRDYLSAMTLKTMDERTPEVFQYFFAEFGPSKGTNGCIYKHTAHNIRNRNTNKYHIIARRVLRALVDSTLFDANEVLTLTKEQKRIIYDYKNKGNLGRRHY